ncbi:helix-turn-helix domain-containing protein [Actinokineospora sp. 24-640]
MHPATPARFADASRVRSLEDELRPRHASAPGHRPGSALPRSRAPFHASERTGVMPPIDPHAWFARHLGDELRTIRRARGWTHRDLHALLIGQEAGHDLSVKTLANYEYGTRRMTVDWFMRLCTALGENASTVLHRAAIRTFEPTHPPRSGSAFPHSRPLPTRSSPL